MDKKPIELYPNDEYDLPKEYWEAIVASDPFNPVNFKHLAEIWAKEYYQKLLSNSEQTLKDENSDGR